RLEFETPSRGLIGFRNEFLTETKGTGLLNTMFLRWGDWQGALRGRATGSLVADRTGETTTYALFNLQERGTLFIRPGIKVYEGMIIGENARAVDLDVNAIKEKKLTNMRASSLLKSCRSSRRLSLSATMSWSKLLLKIFVYASESLNPMNDPRKKRVETHSHELQLHTSLGRYSSLPDH